MLVTQPYQFTELLATLTKARYFAFDTETTGLSPYTEDRIIGLSFGVPQPDCSVATWYVPFRHWRGKRLNFNPKRIAEFASIFGDETKTVVGWNSKFDCHFLHVDKIKIKAKVLDAMLAWHLSDENLMNYSLKDLAKRKLTAKEVQDDADLKRLLQSERIDKSNMKALSPLEAAPYAESDSELTWKMFRLVVPRLQKEGLSGLFYEVCEYARVLERCERRGIRLNPMLCNDLIANAAAREGELLAELQKLAGIDFNPKSSAQCRKWLGLSSTAREYLERMEYVPGVAELLEYRGHAKALDTFYLPFRERRDRWNRVHASFKLHGTVAGRLSCTSPNLQQIPRTSTQWQRVKGMIVASPGCKLLSSDLSQAELRLMAHYSQDPFLLSAYEKNLDLHQLVADEVGLSRQQAKTLSFAICYGAGVPGVSKQLACTEHEAESYLRKYHRRIPGIKKLYYYCQNLAEGQGYVELWTGRRRRFPRLPNGYRVGTQTAMNNIIQGGVAEIVRLAMTKTDKVMAATHVILPQESWMLAQVHDEVLCEAKTVHLSDFASVIKHCLENTHKFRIPILADQKIGTSWGTMVEYNG